MPELIERPEPGILLRVAARYTAELGVTTEDLARDLQLDLAAADYESASRLRSALERYISHQPPERRRIVAGDLGPSLNELDARLKSAWNDCPPICEPHGAPGRKP